MDTQLPCIGYIIYDLDSQYDIFDATILSEQDIIDEASYHTYDDEEENIENLDYAIEVLGDRNMRVIAIHSK